MIHVKDEIQSNPYIRSKLGFSYFIYQLNDAVANNTSIASLLNQTFIHAWISYPSWQLNSDIFQYLNADDISLLQSKQATFILDATFEGFSTIYHVPFFDILHYNCTKYNIDPSQVIFVSSNLYDEKNYANWLQGKNFNHLNVLSLNAYGDPHGSSVPSTWHNFIKDNSGYNLWIDYIKSQVTSNFSNKFYSNCSRRNRFHRSKFVFMLSKSKAYNYGLISHNASSIEEITPLWFFLSNTEYNEDDVNQWLKTLPLVIDRPDFEVQWASDPAYSKIYDKTLFSITNETYQDDFYQTSMFFSEKTFRPIMCAQPFLINGAPYSHRHLEMLGYKLYHQHFDYSFDTELDMTTRFKKIIKVAEDTCQYLSSMTQKQQIAWRFQCEDILIHNLQVFYTNQYNKQKICSFLNTVSNRQ